MARPKPFSNESMSGITRELAAAEDEIERLTGVTDEMRQSVQDWASVAEYWMQCHDRLADKLRRITAMAQLAVDTGGREELHPDVVLQISDPEHPLSEDQPS